MKNRVGEKYGRLTIISFDKIVDKKKYYWNCQCECDNIKSIIYISLITGTTKSCGCLNKELMKDRFKTHGYTSNHKKLSEYYVWQNMINRCYRVKDKNYHRYGGRGIIVCQDWLDSFENFINDMGVKPNKKDTLDRINNDGNYEKSNCRWVSMSVQGNNKSNNVKIINTVTNEVYPSFVNAAKSLRMNLTTLKQQLTGRNPNKTNLKILTNETIDN